MQTITPPVRASKNAPPPPRRTSVTYSTFAHNLDFLMKQKGVLPGQLATDLEVSPFRVDRWLSQKCYPKMELLVALCEYFDFLDIYRLLTEKLV